MVVDYGYTQWQVFAFYTSTTLLMAFALLNLLLTGFLVVGAQGLTLRGPPNSVARCVQILSDFWPLVRFNLVLSLLALIGTGSFICWMKLSEIPGYPYTAIGVTVIFVLALLGAERRIHRLWYELRIPSDDLVRGDLNVTVNSLQPLQAGAAGSGPDSPAPGSPRSVGHVDIISENEAVIPVAQR